MDLIVWRHAEAVELELVGCDLERYLTHKGDKQAARMAAWLPGGDTRSTTSV